MKPTRLLSSVSLILLLVLVACNFQFSSAPTPFNFPTPDLTLTAYFSTLATPASQPATPTGQIPVFPTATQIIPAVTATSEPVILPTNTFPPPPPSATNTQVPSPTIIPSATKIPERPGEHVIATYLPTPPTIDADLQDWNLTTYFIDEIVYGKNNWSGSTDQSGKFMIGWDENYLYIAIWVIDEIYSQIAPGENLYKGDSVEILFDTMLGMDFNSDSLSSDDFQLGISPGTTVAGDNPNAYLWFPSNMEGKRSNVLIDGRWTEKSYSIEIAVPWNIFSVNPEAGRHYGFALSLSDNDTEGEARQESMVSNVPGRLLTDPTTWGDLFLKK